MNPVLIKCLSFTSFHISFFSVFDHHMKKVRCKSISMRLEGSMAKWMLNGFGDKIREIRLYSPL